MSSTPGIAQAEAALRAAGGLLTYAARRLGISRRDLQRLVEQTPQLQLVIDDIQAELLDLAEFNIILAIKNGDIAMSKWYLNWIERKKRSSQKEAAAAAKRFRETLASIVKGAPGQFAPGTGGISGRRSH